MAKISQGGLGTLLMVIGGANIIIDPIMIISDLTKGQTERIGPLLLIFIISFMFFFGGKKLLN